MLHSQLAWMKLAKPAYFERWSDLKALYKATVPKTKYKSVTAQAEFSSAEAAAAVAKRSKKKIRLTLNIALQGVGLSFVGRQHCGIEDCRNTAKLAAYLIGHGSLPEISGDYTAAADAEAAGGGTVQMSSNGAKSEGSAESCKCGVKPKTKTVNKPGPNHGKQFLSCGKWKQLTGSGCDFFLWIEMAEKAAGSN